jgi:hypothetical protein
MEGSCKYTGQTVENSRQGVTLYRAGSLRDDTQGIGLGFFGGYLKTSRVFLIYFPMCPNFGTMQIRGPNVRIYQILNARGTASIKYQFAQSSATQPSSSQRTARIAVLPVNITTDTFNGLSVLQVVIFQPQFYSMSISSCP